jgi:CRISPR-associated protein Cmr4
MFEEKRILFLYVDTPLHVGAGRGAGGVDLPIQRERTTGYPMVQSSGLKGCLRNLYRSQKCHDDDNHPDLLALFGKAGESGENWAGAIAPGDARLLLFPVRSLAGVFAWTTSCHALANFKRACELSGTSMAWTIPETPANDEALVTEPTDVKAGHDVVLEEFSFTPKVSEMAKTIATWLSGNAIPDGYEYWFKALPRRLVILPENAYRDFTLYATEVQTHVRLDPKKKSAIGGALWTTESLPVDTLLYAPIMASGTRNGTDSRSASQVLDELNKLQLSHLQLGGDETTGQGWVAARIFPGISA